MDGTDTPARRAAQGRGVGRILRTALAAVAGVGALAGCSLSGPPPEPDYSGQQRLEAAVAALEGSPDFRRVRSETSRREDYFTKDLLGVEPRSLEVELVPEADTARAAALLEQIGAEHDLVPVAEVDSPHVVLSPDGSPDGPVMAAETWRGLLEFGRARRFGPPTRAGAAAPRRHCRSRSPAGPRYHLEGDAMRSLRTGRPLVDVVLHHDERTDGPLDDVTVEASQRARAERFADAAEDLLDAPVDVEVHVGKGNGPEMLVREGEADAG